eukprot:9357364-Pyramimonas_sp.AAC.1
MLALVGRNEMGKEGGGVSSACLPRVLLRAPIRPPPPQKEPTETYTGAGGRKDEWRSGMR